jgi:hypothetical protein
MGIAFAVSLLLPFGLTSCRVTRFAAPDDSAVIDAVVQFRQREGWQSLYKVYERTSPRSSDYAEGETDAPPDVIDSLRRRNRQVAPVPTSRRYLYALTSILSSDVIRVSLPGYSQDGRFAAIYIEGPLCTHDDCEAGGVLHLRRDGAEWRIVEEED